MLENTWVNAEDRFGCFHQRFQVPPIYIRLSQIAVNGISNHFLMGASQIRAFITSRIDVSRMISNQCLFN